VQTPGDGGLPLIVTCVVLLPVNKLRRKGNIQRSIQRKAHPANDGQGHPTHVNKMDRLLLLRTLQLSSWLTEKHHRSDYSHRRASPMITTIAYPFPILQCRPSPTKHYLGWRIDGIHRRLHCLDHRGKRSIKPSENRRVDLPRGGMGKATAAPPSRKTKP